MRNVVTLLALVLIGANPTAASEKWNRIVVDMSKGTVTPSDPVVNTASGSDVAITLLNGDKAIPVDQVLFRFARTVYQRSPSGAGITPVDSPEGFTIGGPSLSLNFRSCSALLALGVQGDPNVLCPVILVQTLSKTPVATVYSDEDGIEVFAESSTTKTFDVASTTRIPILIGVVKRRASLSYSAGLSFFNKADERWGLAPIDADDKKQTLVRLDQASRAYKLAANANYMGLFGPPALGVTFGIATNVPFESLATMLGFTYTIRTLPLVNSANLTAGVAYSPHKVLLPEYRGHATVPAGIAVSGLTAEEHDFGVFFGFSFNFAGGEEQFKTVFSGGGKAEEPAKP
jgi:hypothetical protein